MPFPPELQDIAEDTAVIGNIDLFMQYYTSGQAARDYDERMALRLRDLAELAGYPPPSAASTSLSPS